MSLYQNLVKMQLAAAGATTVCLSQTKGAAGNLTINGTAASGGVATLDVPRRVLVTSTGDDSGITITITGTGFNGLALSETVAGTDGMTVYTQHDFATVTKVAVSGAVADHMSVGTNGIGSSIPIIMDTVVNPASYGCACVVGGTVNYTVEISYDDFAPAWDLNANTPTWFAATTAFTGASTNIAGTIAGPCTMIRLTVNSGTDPVSMKLIKPIIAGPF